MACGSWVKLVAIEKPDTTVLNTQTTADQVQQAAKAVAAAQGSASQARGYLQANVNNTAFIQVSSAKVYSGGGTIDNNGWPISIASRLRPGISSRRASSPN